MKMEPLPRPAYLDAQSPKGALISFHSEQARLNREQIAEQMLFEAEHFPARDGFSPDKFMERVEAAKWEDGSILAVWRDRMRFHEQCVEFLTNG